MSLTLRSLYCIALLMFSLTARADYMDGNKLYDHLTGTGVVDTMYAQGYVLGVHDAHSLNKQYCVPLNATGKQLTDLVRKVLAGLPHIRDLPAQFLVHTALTSAWPCKGKDEPADQTM